MQRILVVLLGAALLVRPVLASEAEAVERRPDADEDVTARPTQAEVVALLKKRIAGETVKSLGPIDLGGFHYARTLDLGGGRSVVAVSCNLGGGLLAFGATGDFIAARRTWEQASVQLVDLEGDGQDEVITVEKDGVGTGLVSWMYHAYRLAPDRWEHLWSGVSYESISVGSRREVREGLLRFANAGTDRVRLVYVERSGDSNRWSTSEWALDGGKFKRGRPAR